MANEPITGSPASQSVQAAHVYAMAGLCLVTGLAIGYLFSGSQASTAGKQPPVAANMAKVAPSGAVNAGDAGRLAEMKLVADKQAAPLLEKLKSDPNNSAVLAQVAAIYHTTHQFKDAAAYYEKAVQADPKNVALRTKFASSLYRNGDVDGAIAQLNEGLRYDAKDANSLFDLGLIKLQGKQDGKGALAAWQKLLKSNPQLSAERKATVQKLMADVLTTMNDQHGSQGTGSNDGHKSEPH